MKNIPPLTAKEKATLRKEAEYQGEGGGMMITGGQLVALLDEIEALKKKAFAFFAKEE